MSDATYCLWCGDRVPVPFPVTGEWGDPFCSDRCADWYEQAHAWPEEVVTVKVSAAYL